MVLPANHSLSIRSIDALQRLEISMEKCIGHPLDD